MQEECCAGEIAVSMGLTKDPRSVGESLKREQGRAEVLGESDLEKVSASFSRGWRIDYPWRGRAIDVVGALLLGSWHERMGLNRDTTRWGRSGCS